MRNPRSLLNSGWSLKRILVSSLMALALILSPVIATGRSLSIINHHLIEANPPIQSSSTQTPPVQTIPATPLAIGKPLARELKSGDSHGYTFTLEANQYLYLMVEQQGIDVAVQCFDPGGELLVEVDSPNGDQGPEKLELVVSRPGIYRVEVKSFDSSAPSGKYLIELKMVRLGTADDKHRITERILAQKLIAEAEGFRVQNTEKSHRLAFLQYEAAIPHCQASGELELEIETLNNLGRIISDLGENHKALEYYQQALPKAESLLNKSYVAVLGNNIGAAHWYLGSIQKAAEAYERALPLWRELKNEFQLSVTLNNLSNCHLFIGQLEKAKGYLLEALSIQEASGNIASQITTLGNLGSCYWYLNQKTDARKTLEKALGLTDRVRSNPVKKAEILRNLAYVYSDTDQVAQAIEYFQQARKLFELSGNRFRRAETLASLGFIAYRQKDQKAAITYFDEAIQLTKPDEYCLWLPEMNFILSLIKTEAGQLFEAQAYLEKAIQFIERLRQQVPNQDFRLHFFHDHRQYYQTYVSLLMKLHDLNPTAGHDIQAFERSEQARGRVLLDLLSEAKVDIRKGADQKLLEQEQLVQKTLNAKINQLLLVRADSNQATLARPLQGEVNTLLDNLDEIRARIKTTSPGYAALTQPHVVKLTEVQQKYLDPDTLLLVYGLGETESYLWLVSQTSLESYVLPSQKIIEATVQSVYQTLSWKEPIETRSRGKKSGVRSRSKRSKSKPPSVEPPGDPIQISQALSQMLLGPVADRLGTKRLAVVADGTLNLIPFAALPLPEKQAASAPTSATKVTFLIEQHEIVNLPSVSALAALWREPRSTRPATAKLFAVADPVFSSTENRVIRPASTRSPKSGTTQRHPDEPSSIPRGGGFARLPFTRKEVTRIASFFPSSSLKQLLDFDASREAILQEDLSQYAFVHFATHGVYDAEHPALSGLVLTLVNQQGKPAPGFLGLPDIYNLTLQADLVVLSSCNSGLGKLVNGEGVIGLNRGFLYAGASRIVSSLWKVDDRLTAILMEALYKSMIQEQLPPAQALRKAQLNVLKQPQWKSPRDWAAFQLHGDWR